MSNFRRISLLILCIVLCTFRVFASTYVIDGYDIEIIGRTRESAIRRRIGYDEGKEFKSREALELEIERKRQSLLELRIFKDVATSWTKGKEKDGQIPVTIRFLINGALSFILFPGVAYDSNYGFFTQLYAEDHNFLGTTGRTNFSISIQENDNRHDPRYSDISSYVTLSLPLGRNWTIYNRLSLTHSGKTTENSHLSFENSFSRRILETGGISNSFHMDIFTESEDRSGIYSIGNASETIDLAPNDMLTFSCGENLSTPEDNGTLHISLNTFLGASLNLKRKVGIDLTPSVRLDMTSLDGSSISMLGTFKLGVSDSMVSWDGDFRKGYSYKLNASAKTDGKLLMTGDARLYVHTLSWLQLSTKLEFRLANYEDRNRIRRFADDLRGIRNDNPSLATEGIESVGALNLDAMVKLLEIPILGRAYAGAFLEMGYTSLNQFLLSAGFELIFVLSELPGSPGRLSIGRNLLDPSEFEFTASAFFFY